MSMFECCIPNPDPTDPQDRECWEISVDKGIIDIDTPDPIIGDHLLKAVPVLEAVTPEQRTDIALVAYVGQLTEHVQDSELRSRFLATVDDLCVGISSKLPDDMVFRRAI